MNPTHYKNPGGYRIKKTDKTKYSCIMSHLFTLLSKDGNTVLFEKLMLLLILQK